MYEVQPIRDRDKLRSIAITLKKRNEKYYIMFILGCESGLRISDILPLRVHDVRHFDVDKIYERKTHKKRFVYLSDEVKEIIYDYIDDNKMVDPIGKVQAYKVIREAGEDNRVWGLGTHSMRKTFGYHYYKMTGDIVTLMKILNHCDPAVTLRYIGIEEEEIKQSLKHFNLFKKEDLVAEKPDKLAVSLSASTFE